MHFCLKNPCFVLQKLSKMGTLQRDTGSDTMISNQSGFEFTPDELLKAERLIIFSSTEGIGGICFYAESGDDVYAVIDSCAYDGEHPPEPLPGKARFVYVKMLYGPEGDCTHFISEGKLFTKQFDATVYLCEQAAEEERGYGAQ